MQDQDKTQLAALEQEIQNNAGLLEEACALVQDQEISNYPIIFTAIQPIEIGVAMPQMQSKTNWIYKMTTLEELATKKLINMNEVDSFRLRYKQRKDHLCVFAVYGANTQLIFIPLKFNLEKNE